MKLKWILLLFCAVVGKHSTAQEEDFTWWNNNANWDGVTPWTNYITLSSKFMGPNALPVPNIKTGTMPNPNVQLAMDVHESDGDDAQNVFTELHIPLFTNRVGLNFQMVPVERYVMDTVTRDERLARDRDGSGFAVGDLYIGTYIQLIKDATYLPDVLLTINIKTASGSHFFATRYTDTPGYFFDLSAGKKIELRKGGWLKAIQPHAMAGFYVYQTNLDRYLQNDCFLYGAGVNLYFSKLQVNNALGGYVGYINNGDRPMVYRMQVQTSFTKKVNYLFRYQQGFFDYPFTSFRLGVTVNLTDAFPSTAAIK